MPTIRAQTPPVPRPLATRRRLARAIVLIGLLAAASATAAETKSPFAEPPRFFIESIAVDGAKRVSPEINSRLSLARHSIPVRTNFRSSSLRASVSASSKMASAIWSQNLSGWPSDTCSAVRVFS